MANSRTQIATTLQQSLTSRFAPAKLLSAWMPLGADLQSYNTRRVLLDGLGIAVGTAAAPFLPVLLARLGASDFSVGILSAMPALAGLLFILPVSRLLARQPYIVPWYSVARLMIIAAYALSGIATLLVPDWRVFGILLIWALATIPQTIVDVCFTIVMSGVAGPDRRFYLMSRRWSSIGLVTAITVALAGIALTTIPFPLSYQIVLPALALGGLFAYYFAKQIRLPRQATTTNPVRTANPNPSFSASLSMARRQSKFVRFTASQFVYRLGLAWALPLIPLYYVHNLHADDAQVGLINTVSSSVLLVAYFIWSRISRRRGVRFALLATTLGFSLYPIVLSQLTQVGWVVVLAGLSGVFAAGIDLVFFESLVSSYPPESSTMFLGLYQTTVYLVTFIGPLAGTAVAQSIGIPGSLLVGGVLRLAGFGLFAYLLKK